MQVGVAELVHPKARDDPQATKEAVRDPELAEGVNENHPEIVVITYYNNLPK